jgi:hypothetical protein
MIPYYAQFREEKWKVIFERIVNTHKMSVSDEMKNKTIPHYLNNSEIKQQYGRRRQNRYT